MKLLKKSKRKVCVEKPKKELKKARNVRLYDSQLDKIIKAGFKSLQEFIDKKVAGLK